MSTRISIRKRKGKKELFGILCCVFILSVSGCGKESISFGGEQETTAIAEQETAAASEQKTVKTAEQPPNLEEPHEEEPHEEESQAEEPQAEEPEQVISILMVGDILLHTPVEESAHTQQDTYDFRPIFSELKEEISAADLALVNQEVIIGGQELGISGYPAFNAPYPIADALADAGFDVVCQATNHALDKGEKGVRNDLAYWESKYPDMVVTGIQDSEEKQRMIPTVCVDDVTFAILNYTYGTNGIPLPQNMPYAVNLLEEEKVKRDLQIAEETADFTIVCPHWGTEYQLAPSAEQEYWTNIFLEGGADLVIGTHPHVIQPVEMIQDEGKEMLVYYSLGNFVNWTSGTGDGVANRMVGGMAQIEVTRENDDVVIKEYGVKPLITHVSEGYGGVRTYALEDYTASLEQENLIKKQDSNFSLSYAETLCEKVWGEQESLW